MTKQNHSKPESMGVIIDITERISQIRYRREIDNNLNRLSAEARIAMLVLIRKWGIQLEKLSSSELRYHKDGISKMVSILCRTNSQ